MFRGQINLFYCSWILLMGAAYAMPSEDCRTFYSAANILACAKEQHPLVKEAAIISKRAKWLKGIARQRPNPELETQIGMGKSDGDNVVTTDSALSFTIEMGGKRNARISRAQAQINRSKSELQAVKENVTLDIVTILHRLRQIASEKLVIEEALSVFNKVINPLRKRKHRNPEQVVSFIVYDTAKSDYLMQKSVLKSEENRLRQEIEFAVGRSLVWSSKILPNALKNWPQLQEKAKAFTNARWENTKAELQLAKSDKKIAVSESWPDLKIGPSLQVDTVGKLTEQRYGIGLTLPLPLFNLNGAGRAYARNGIELAKMKMNITAKQLVNEYDRARFNYKSAVSILKQMKSRKKLNREHQRIEKLIGRGLVPSSLVVEVHRQLFEVTKNYHQQEMTAIQSLWNVYRIEGSVLEEMQI